MSILAGFVGCGGEPPPAAAGTPTPAAKAAPAAGADPHGKAVIPHHDPAAMGGAENEIAFVEATGFIEATMSGVPMRFEFLPTGSNVAIVDLEHDVARVNLGGAPTDKGIPLLRVSLDGVRIDRLTLPASFTTVGPDAPPGAKTPKVRLEYRITDDKIWRSVAGGTVTIDSYSGKRVRGTFQGKLEPKSTAFGPPIEVTAGTFDVELRLKGAAPGPA